MVTYNNINKKYIKRYMKETKFVAKCDAFTFTMYVCMYVVNVYTCASTSPIEVEQYNN